MMLPKIAIPVYSFKEGPLRKSMGTPEIRPNHTTVAETIITQLCTGNYLCREAIPP